MGDIWSKPVVPGQGLVLFNRTNSEYAMNTTDEELHLRAAVQQDDGSVFGIMQNPEGIRTSIAKLQQQGDQFVTLQSTTLPACHTSHCDGADVMLGASPDTLFVTDRAQAAGAPGKLHYYTMDNTGFKKVKSWETGEHPRYTTIAEEGSIVSCNRLDGTTTTFIGLVETVDTWDGTTLGSDAVPEVSFYIEYESECEPTSWWLYVAIGVPIFIVVAGILAFQYRQQIS